MQCSPSRRGPEIGPQTDGGDYHDDACALTIAPVITVTTLDRDITKHRVVNAEHRNDLTVTLNTALT
jgi:hypothetical protein